MPFHLNAGFRPHESSQANTVRSSKPTKQASENFAQEQSRISEPKSEEEPLQESFREEEKAQPDSPSPDKDPKEDKEDKEPIAVTEQSREESFVRKVPRSGGLSPFTAAHVEAASPAKWQTRSQNCVAGGEVVAASPP